VRSISFTELVSSAKGLTATTTTESHPTASKIISSGEMKGGGGEVTTGGQLRRRSASIGVSNEDESKPAMQIIGCMNDFGLGNILWW